MRARTINSRDNSYYLAVIVAGLISAYLSDRHPPTGTESSQRPSEIES